MRRQDKIAEIWIHHQLLEHLKEDYKSSGWGEKKINRALTYLFGFLEPNKNHKCLDLGCGGGTLTQALVKRENLSIVSFDLVKEIILQVTRKRVPSVPYVAGDAEELPFKENSFDIVIHNQTLHHFPTQNFVLAEIARVLKRDGFLLSIETNGYNPYVVYGHVAPWNKRKRFISKNQKVFGYFRFKKQLEEAGFKILGAKTINFDFIKPLEHFEDFLERFSLTKFLGGSTVVCSQKKILIPKNDSI